MAVVSGTIRIGEATPTVKSTAQRQRGGTFPFTFLLLCLWLGGALVGFAAGWVVGFDRILAGCAGAVVGLLSYRPLCRVLSVHLHRKMLTAKGTPLDLPVRLEVLPDIFVYEIADVRMHAKWRAVTDVFHDKGWWIFMVQSDPWFAADRFFASEDEARAFIAAVLAHISDEARARSPDAVHFIGG